MTEGTEKTPPMAVGHFTSRALLPSEQLGATARIMAKAVIMSNDEKARIRAGERKATIAVLKKYTTHLGNCLFWMGELCDCGLSQALKEGEG